MSGHVTYPSGEESRPVSSAELSERLAGTDFSGYAATVVGYGNMGREHVKALRALGVERIRVCSRTEEPLRELQGVDGISLVAGGFEQLQCRAQDDELGIVSTPTVSLASAAERLASLGFRRMLIEKPVSLWSSQIQRLAETLERQGVEAAAAYNRVAYPSFRELCARASSEGGITSCTYTFTEFIDRIVPTRYPREELVRWGIANSLHVMSMAHGLIGLPASWSGHRSGALPWHPTGAVFVGSGISDRGISFAYHADWGSTGRWSMEVHTAVSSYRLCPLEKLHRRTSPFTDWSEIQCTHFSDCVKAGFVEQLAAALMPTLREAIPLVPLAKAAKLTLFAENIFGYESSCG